MQIAVVIQHNQPIEAQMPRQAASCEMPSGGSHLHKEPCVMVNQFITELLVRQRSANATDTVGKALPKQLGGYSSGASPFGWPVVLLPGNL